MKRINVTKSLLPHREKFHTYVDKILDSGWLTNRGQLVQELEIRLAEYLGVRNVVLTANGTIALQVAYKLFDLQGEIITSPFTFIATASSAKWEGLDVVFADIDQGSWNIDPMDIERKISKRTSAIMPVHVFGNPCDVEAIEVLAKKNGLKIIYDAAHAFGIQYKGESLLNWGDVSILSFHATKLFHTIEGGALIINDDMLYEQAKKMINFGITGPELIECLGINGKMNEFQAAMGLCLLDEMDGTIERRARATAIYDLELKKAVIKQEWKEGASNNHGYYSVLFDSEAITQQVQFALNREGIYPRRYFYPPLDTLDFIAQGQVADISRDIAGRILCLPLYAGLTDEECRMIACIVLDTLGGE